MNDSKNISNSNDQIKLNLKTIIVLILFLVGIYFVIPRLIDAQQAVQLISKVNKYYLILAILFEILSYIGAAMLMGIILSQMGHRIAFWDRFRIGSMAAFAIHFFPLGSLGGGAVDFYFLRKKKVKSGSILMMLLLRIIISYIAFFILFIIALTLLPTIENISLTMKIISGGILVILVFGTIYFLYLYKHKEKFRKVFHIVFSPARFFSSRLKYPVDKTRLDYTFEEFYESLKLFSQKKRSTILAILTGMVYWLGDMLCFFFVFLSFGYLINFGVLMFSYSIGLLAGMVSFIPGGLGVTEGTLGLVLTSLGVPSTIALMSILIFRLFSFWMWIPFGLYSFLSLRKAGKSLR